MIIMASTNKVVKMKDSKLEVATQQSSNLTKEQVISKYTNFYNNRQNNIIEYNKTILGNIPKGQEPTKEQKEKLRAAKYATKAQVTRYIEGLNEAYFNNLAKALKVMEAHYKELGKLVWGEAKANTVELMKEIKAVKDTNAQLEEANKVLEAYNKEQQEIIKQLESELKAIKQNNSEKESA